ncbi:D-2-hydroxyacid dehydrogenase [Halopenitus persicus]|uniref:Phosphoglycerate dehydrogenase n=1 Tax=Halopenitus persicus TaxID=1048396 RepID=A0A1H3MC93_9EURY|nr:D-2-hydroxyacid dehydrogenase [Halopenitus persicus]SDY73645.1 Phosphoglycerate dehydrogenase [Halopenitus persicus]
MSDPDVDSSDPDVGASDSDVDSPDPDVLVLRQKLHGQDGADYAAILRERLPDRNIVHPATPDEQREYLRTARVATGFELDRDQLAAAENLELFAGVYAGTGHLDLEAFEDHGVAVTNASGVHVPNISEHVIGSLIAHARQFPRAWDNKQRGAWQTHPVLELQGSTVAIVGLGAIGTGIARRLDAFGVETLGVRYTPEKGGPTDEVYGFDDVHAAVAAADHVVLACPLTETTAGLVDAELLTSMPTHGILVNIARGGVVETDALLEALRHDEIRAAALDVTDPEPLPNDHPLWDLDNVTITAHNAGNTPNYFDRCAEILAGNVERLASGAELENRVV